MSKRYPTKRSGGSHSFTRNAMKVHKKNNWSNPMRGGFRL